LVENHVGSPFSGPEIRKPCYIALGKGPAFYDDSLLTVFYSYILNAVRLSLIVISKY
jgi:hypothetical protein